MASKAAPLEDVYKAYIRAILDCDLDSMSTYVNADVIHNGRCLGLDGYKDLLLKHIIQTEVGIAIKRLVADEFHVAAVLIFTVPATTRELVGVKLKGETFSYVENVIYDFRDGKIAEVHSLFDIDELRAHASEESC